MLRLDPNNLPKHLKKQIEQKLAQSNIIAHNYTEKPVKPTSLIKIEEKSISKIHAKLWEAVSHLEGATLEFKGAIPRRRFSLDIAFPELKIAIEVDGWEFHGKHKSSHTKDRERQNLLTLHGWRILRYTAKQIFGNISQCVSEIKQLIGIVKMERTWKPISILPPCGKEVLIFISSSVESISGQHTAWRTDDEFFISNMNVSSPIPIRFVEFWQELPENPK